MKNLKKVMVAMAVSAVVSMTPAFALDWTTANQSTIAWDAVTQTVEGKDFPEGDVIEYEVYLVTSSSTDRAADKLLQTKTDLLEYTITFPAEGKWLVGLRTSRKPVASPEDIQYSTFIWSDSTDVTMIPTPFGFVYFAIPKNVTGVVLK